MGEVFDVSGSVLPGMEWIVTTVTLMTTVFKKSD